MQTPLQLDFHNMHPSEAVEARVREKVARLNELCEQRLTGCNVVIQAPHKHQRKGQRYHIRIRLDVPGGELAVSHDPAPHAHEDINAAVRDAFEAAVRQLKEFLARQRGEVKAHVNGKRAAAGE
jgi:ribosome-associated translation inhibitor RaiA